MDSVTRRICWTGRRGFHQRLGDGQIADFEVVLIVFLIATLYTHIIRLIDGVSCKGRRIRVHSIRLHGLRQMHSKSEFQTFVHFQRIIGLLLNRVTGVRYGARSLFVVKREAHHRGRIGHRRQIEYRAVQHVFNHEIVRGRRASVRHHQSHGDFITGIHAVGRRNGLFDGNLGFNQSDQRAFHFGWVIGIVVVSHGRLIGQHSLWRKTAVVRFVQHHGLQL